MGGNGYWPGNIHTYPFPSSIVIKGRTNVTLSQVLMTRLFAPKQNHYYSFQLKRKPKKEIFAYYLRVNIIVGIICKEQKKIGARA